MIRRHRSAVCLTLAFALAACADGLSPSNAADRNADADADGYTNLEEYLNSLVP